MNDLQDNKSQQTAAAAPPAATGPTARASMPWLGAALVAALFFWASAFTAIRVGLEGYSPQSLAFVRFFVGSLTIALIAALMSFRWPTRRDLPLLILAAVAGGPIYHVSLNYAEVTVGAGSAALLINTSPVMAALLAAAVLRERLGVFGWVGTIVSFLGAAVIATGKGWDFDPRALWVLVAAAAGAVYVVAQKPLFRSLTPVSFTAWSIWIGTVCLLPMFPRAYAEMRQAPASATLAAVYMGVFPTAVSYAMWATIVSRMNVSRAVSFLYLVPVLAVAIAWAWLGEMPTRVAVVGGCMIVGGVVLVNAAKAKQKSSAAAGGFGVVPPLGVSGAARPEA